MKPMTVYLVCAGVITCWPSQREADKYKAMRGGTYHEFDHFPTEREYFDLYEG